MRRAQVFTADFLVSCAVLLLIMGLSLNSSEVVLRGALSNALDQGGPAEAVAAKLAAGQGASNYSPYCFSLSNGSGNCASFSCADGKVLVARRLVACNGSGYGGACALEVRQCG
jgi:hypothetical protein